MARVWAVVVGGALLAPLVSWLPMLTAHYPRVPLPAYEGIFGSSMWPAQVYWLTLLSALALLVGQRDRWLGAAVWLAGLVIFLRGAMMDPTHSILFGMGALLLVGMRQTPAVWKPRIAVMLAGLGLFEVAYVWHQLFGYDLFWATLWGLPVKDTQQPLFPPSWNFPTIIRALPLGTLNTVDGVGAFIAVTAPLMPLWALPFAAGAVFFGYSLTAMAAFVTGLSLRYAQRTRLGWAMMASGTLLALVMLLVKGVGGVPFRAAVWAAGLGLTATTNPVLGWGLGGWIQRFPSAQVHYGLFPTPEIWQQAHNEPVQWVVETGLVGLVILIGWCWTHRGMFRVPVWGPSVGALAVDSLGFFPFHVVPLALLGIVVVGLATAEEVT